jgi:hypothetical protein
MKNFILFVMLLALGVWHLQAQNASFTLSNREARGQGPNSMFMIEAKSIFTNISTDPTDTMFRWKVLSITMPAGWEFGMCDPINCLTNIAVNDEGFFSLKPNNQGEFKGDFVPNNISGIGTAKVLINSVKFPERFDTLTYIVNAWVTSVKEVSLSKEVSVFPNPAKERVTLKYPTKEIIAIEIYNVLGTRVKTFYHSGLESEINIGDLKSGVYFIRIRDGNQTVSKQLTLAN